MLDNHNDIQTEALGTLASKDLQLPTDCFLLKKQNPGFQIPYYLSSEKEVSLIRPPAVVKTWEQRFSELNPKQQAAFDGFYQIVQGASWYDAAKQDKWTCLRYLVARGYDQKEAFAMLENSVKWRNETGADDWQCDTCASDPSMHMGQFVGWDNHHRPVMFMSMRWGPERKEPLRHMVACFNHLVHMMPVGVEQWVCMTDFETYSHLKDGKPSMGINVIKIIQNHFPERLGMMLCINMPTMFWVLWKLFYPVIDPATRSKVEFLYTEDKPSVYDYFPQLFPKHLCEYLYDTYHRSKHNLPADPLVWLPRQEGYPENFEERKLELKENKKKKKGKQSSEASHASES